MARVNKAFVEAEWPTKEGQFPGVEISFENEDDSGMADLVVEGGATSESIAAALRAEQVPVTKQKPDRPAVAEDFIDHGQERKNVRAELRVEANEVGAGAKNQAVESEAAPKPKRKAATKKG